MIVGVELEREGTAVLNKFKQQMREEEHVQQCYYVTGAFDFVLIVYMSDMRDYEAFTARTMQDNPHVRKFTTMVCMDRTKVTLELPLRTQSGLAPRPEQPIFTPSRGPLSRRHA